MGLLPPFPAHFQRAPAVVITAGAGALLADRNLWLDFFDDFVANPLYLGEVVNGGEISVGGTVGDNGLGFCLADPVECGQLVRIRRVDVHLGKGSRCKKENEDEGQIQFFHSASFDRVGWKSGEIPYCSMVGNGGRRCQIEILHNS